MQPFLLVPALLVLFAIHVQAFGSTKPKLNSVEKFKEAMTAFASELVGPAEPETEKLMGSADSPDLIQDLASVVFSPSTMFNDDPMCQTIPQGTCREECERFESSSQCTRNGDTKVFLQDVASCSACKRCLRDRARISGSCPQVCDCYTVPIKFPEWCWWNSLNANGAGEWCISDMFQSPVGKQTCDQTTPSGWRAAEGNWDMTDCAGADRCAETIEHRPICWYDTSGTHKLCYTEDRWRPSKGVFSTRNWELSEQDGRMDNCMKWNAQPCAAFREERITGPWRAHCTNTGKCGDIEFDSTLMCVDDTKELSQQNQVAQRVHRAMKAAELCENKPVGPYYMDDREANAPNDLLYSGEWKSLKTCSMSGHECSFGQHNSCYKDAAMMTKGECEKYGIKSDYDAICMIGARCAKDDLTRGFCPDDMNCEYDEEQNFRWGTAGKKTSAVSTGVCMFADGPEWDTMILFLAIAVAAVALLVVAFPAGIAVGAATGSFYAGTGVMITGAQIGAGGLIGGVSGAIVTASQGGGRRLDTPLLPN